MTIWFAIFVGSAAVFSWKIIGSMLPDAALNHPVVSRLANLITVALLASLFGVQGFTAAVDDATNIAFDARVPAIGVAVVLLLVRAPFLVVVASAALVAALLRFFL